MNKKHKHSTNQHYLSRFTTYTSPRNLHAQSDNRERGEVIYKLKQRKNNAGSSQAIALEAAVISLETGSTLNDALQPGRSLLQALSEHAAFKKLMSVLKPPQHALFEVTAAGEINALYSGQTLGFANAFKLAPNLQDELQVLVEMAQATGGSITLAEHVELTQWLKFHGYVIPGTTRECARLIAFMELPAQASPLQGNYWEMLNAGADNAVTLTADQRSEFRKLITSYIKDQSLLEHLSNSVFGGQSAPFRRAEAEAILEKLVSSPIALHWSTAYVRDLGWYGAQEHHTQSVESLKQIMLTSLLLDLHPGVGEEQPRNHVAGFNVYAIEHREKSFADVQTEFEKHLIKHHRISERNASLAAHLLLAEAAPEFLVKDLPATLSLGTPDWVEFCRMVTAQEIIAPGSTRSMTYAQLQQLAKLGEVLESRKTLDAVAAVDPVLDWALLNQIVTQDTVEKSTTQALEMASAAYARHAATLVETAKTLARPLPTRKSVALDILKQVAKGCTYLESDVLYHKRNRPLEDAYADPFPVSPLELHMSNDLATGDWDLKNGESLYTAFPRLLPNLISPDGEYHRQFNREFVVHMNAMSTHLKQAFCSMPLLDRTRLLKGKVTMFTIRPSVAKIQTITSVPSNPLASTIDTILKTTERKPTESHKDIEEAKSRYGVVICSEFEGRVTCYELFTLHGICRENTRMAALIQATNQLNTAVMSNGKNYSTPATVHRLPTNIECYTHGVPPGFSEDSSGVIDKIAHLPATARPVPIKGYYQSFYSTDFDPLVNFVLKHRPIATYDELVRECWGQTRLEALRAKRDKDLDTFLNFVVPFKSCIEDLSSDDVERQIQGAGACALEAAMTLLLVVGAVAQAVSLVAKSVTVATRAGALAKTGLGLVSNLINPLDGTADLLLHGAKLLRKGFNKSLTALENAISDARKWSGTTARRQVAARIDSDLIRLGSWRPALTSADVFQVWAIRHNDEWYALNRQGQAWGRKLKNFELKLPALQWHRILPKSYSRAIIKKSLPVAIRKIEDAISVLDDPSVINETAVLLDLLLGNDSAATRKAYRDYLVDVKSDLGKLGPGNFVADGDKDIDAIARLDWGAYNGWKTGGQPAQMPFVHVYSQNFNEAYRLDHFNLEASADVFVHELFHGSPKTKDFAYADASGLYERGAQQLDVSPLLNLANGKLSQGLPSYPHVTFNRGVAFKNADSFALTTSLLGQLHSNKEAYQRNIAVMKSALEKSGREFIATPTLVSLNLL
jgi:hypothetical protein